MGSRPRAFSWAIELARTDEAYRNRHPQQQQAHPSDPFGEDIVKEVTAMLNSKALSELLTKNVHPQLFPRWFVMTPNATLFAYSKPCTVTSVREQAALVSMIWNEHAKKAAEPHPPTKSGAEIADGQLETLTIEAVNCNIIAKAVQPGILLVLVGGIAPDTVVKRSFKVTSERAGIDAKYPPIVAEETDTPVTAPDQIAEDTANLSTSHGSQSDHPPASPSIHIPGASVFPEAKDGLLRIHRSKMDEAVAYLRAAFNSKGFVIPEEPGINV